MRPSANSVTSHNFVERAKSFGNGVWCAYWELTDRFGYRAGTYFCADEKHNAEAQARLVETWNETRDYFERAFRR
jgi:hypothetical protein